MGFPSERIRNVALVGHKGAGKTALVDAMRFIAKAAPNLGANGLDDTPEERAHQATLEARWVRLQWGDTIVNLIDTPGEATLFADARWALSAVDAAILVISATDGVKSGTERAFRWIQESHLPCLAVLTKVDDDGAQIDKVLAAAHERFKEPVDPIEVPVGVGTRHHGVVTLLPPRAWTAVPEGPSATPSPVPASLEKEVQATRSHLVEDVASTDDTLTDKYLTDGDLSTDDLDAGLHADVAQGKLLPVYYASGTMPSGIAALLDAIVAELPAPEAALADPLAAPVAAMVWKTRIDPHVGRLSFTRIRQGVLRSDAHLCTASDGGRERVGQLLQGLGGDLKPVTEAVAGDLVVVTKLKSARTGETLCDEKHLSSLPRPELPQPLFARTLLADDRGKEDKLAAALARLVEEDPGLTVTHDETGHELIVGGAGPLHLDLTLERLKRKSGIQARLGPPRIAYRETLTRAVKNIEGKQKKQTGGHGQFGVCYIDVEPLPRGAGFEFENAIVGGVIPRQFVPSVEKGVLRAMERGILAGYPMVDVKVRVVDGKTHSVDSSDAAFQAAGFKAFRAAAASAHAALLEPVVKLTVSVPNATTGDAIGDVTARRGKVLATETSDDATLITAHVPLAETLDFEPKLASMTQGKGTFTLAFDHYEICPGHVQDKAIAQSGYKVKEEEE
jgi:elongation factor G